MRRARSFATLGDLPIMLHPRYALALSFFVVELITCAGRTVYSSSLARSGWPFDTSPPLVPTPFTVVVPPSSYWSNIGFNSTWRCERTLALGRLP
ncbi:hypothetical protein B0H14DRAFT_100874 [Mycena olivaceomarginata]|nr:hypothetical protein B0H14DRAFT_100874 [Mycena olivaceomarginata]